MSIQRVLVVDDDSFSREFLTEAARSLGINTASCTSGEEALEHVRHHGIDLVFTDLRMPGMSGAELVRKMSQEFPDIPVVVVTAHAGGMCRSFKDIDDHSSCRKGQEIFAVANALAPGTVDVIVAGHTHAGVAHRINGIAVIESFANGRAFGRVDIRYHRETGEILGISERSVRREWAVIRGWLNRELEGAAP